MIIKKLYIRLWGYATSFMNEIEGQNYTIEEFNSLIESFEKELNKETPNINQNSNNLNALIKFIENKTSVVYNVLVNDHNHSSKSLTEVESSLQQNSTMTHTQIQNSINQQLKNKIKNIYSKYILHFLIHIKNLVEKNFKNETNKIMNVLRKICFGTNNEERHSTNNTETSTETSTEITTEITTKNDKKKILENIKNLYDMIINDYNFIEKYDFKINKQNLEKIGLKSQYNSMQSGMLTSKKKDFPKNIAFKYLDIIKYIIKIYQLLIIYLILK